MFKYHHLSHLTDREIHNALVAKGLRSIEIEQIKSSLAEYKTAQRKEKGRERVVRGMWKLIIDPLINEQRSVRASLRYQSKAYPNPERLDALTNYAAVLDKLRKKLRKHQRMDKRTPKEQAQYELDTYQRTIPNDGEHWTDWVPPHIRSAIEHAFASIPARYKARVKTPFERVMLERDNTELRSTYILTVKRELADLAQELAMIRELNQGQPSEAERDVQASKDKYERLLTHLITMDDTAVVPPTWGQLYGEFIAGE